MDPETHSEYRWEDVVVFEECVPQEDRRRLLSAIGDTAMLDLFNSIPNPQPTDYVFFSVIGNVSNDGAWYATRGDWYHDQYIATYGQSTSVVSGNWDKWTSTDGVNWSGVINTGYLNHFGPGCDGEQGSWCSEWGINPNSLNLVISPQDPQRLAISCGRSDGQVKRPSWMGICVALAPTGSPSSTGANALSTFSLGE